MASGIRRKIDISVERVYGSPVPKKMGRPTKKVPRTLARLEEALTKGLPRWAACAYAKISHQAFNEWLHSDPAFAQSVVQWEAAALGQLVAAVRKEPLGNRFLLARRFRSDYGEKVEVEHSGAVSVRFVNDWRGPTADAPSWTADSTSAGQEVQLAGGGETVAEDDAVHGDSGGGGAEG